MSGPDAHGWMPIETAPRDGTEILGFWSYTYDGDGSPTIGMRVVCWETHVLGGVAHSGWVDGDGMTSDGVYTHWQPLPEPPLPPDLGDGQDPL